MKTLQSKRILIFLGVAFGFSWAIAAIVYLTGGIAGSQPLVPGSPVTWALPLMIIYMFGPALGNIVARLLTAEGRHDLWLRPRFRTGWPYWILTWLATPLMVAGGAALYFLLFPDQVNYDAVVSGALPGLPQTGLPGWLVILGMLLIASLSAVVANSLATFGEEFGWRAYLQPKLLPLGERKMYLLVGVIWGIWHWPVIWMGYNYPEQPLLGSLAMVWFTISFGTFIGWATLRAESVWPAVIGHSVMNGTANFSSLLLVAPPDIMLGPVPVGIIGSLFFTVAAALIFLKAPGAEPEPPQGAEEANKKSPEPGPGLS